MGSFRRAAVVLAVVLGVAGGVAGSASASVTWVASGSYTFESDIPSPGGGLEFAGTFGTVKCDAALNGNMPGGTNSVITTGNLVMTNCTTDFGASATVTCAASTDVQFSYTAISPTLATGNMTLYSRVCTITLPSLFGSCTMTVPWSQVVTGSSADDSGTVTTITIPPFDAPYTASGPTCAMWGVPTADIMEIRGCNTLDPDIVFTQTGGTRMTWS